jgi:hypothetical protein
VFNYTTIIKGGISLNWLLKSDSVPVRGDGYKPSLEVQIQSQRRDVVQRAIQPSGSGYEYYGQWWKIFI